MDIKRILLIVLTFIQLFSFDMLAFADTPLQDAQKLRLSLYGEPQILDFQACYSSEEIQICNWIMEGLTRSTDNGRVKPGMAEKWEVSADGIEWTFHLRDAKWTDGKPVTAQDFVFGWFRAIDKKYTSRYGYYLNNIINAEEFSIGKADKKDVGIIALDDKTLKVILKQPVTYFDYLVSLPNFTPVRKDIYEKYGSEYNKESAYFITNGPFTLRKWEHGMEMLFLKNYEYWDEANIKLEQVTAVDMEYIKLHEAKQVFKENMKDEVSMYQQGEIDLIGKVDYKMKAKLSKDELKSYSDTNVWYFNFNCTDPVLKNKNIRKALTYAIDRQHFIENVAKRQWKPALALVQPYVVLDVDGKTFRENTPAYFKDNDITAAKELLQQGMNELKLKKLPKLKLLIIDNGDEKTYGQAFQYMWKKNLGIDVEFDVVTESERVKRLAKHDYQISLGGWALDYPDAISDLDLFVTGSIYNTALYSSTEYDAYIKAAKAEPDKGKRSILLHRAEQLLMDDMPVGPLYYSYRDYAVKPYVKNIKWDSFAPFIDLIYSYIEGKK